jgi:hypothetical protein
MDDKKFSAKLLAMALGSFAGVVFWKATVQQRENKMGRVLLEEEKRASLCLNRFVYQNRLSEEVFTQVSETGITPIYTYNSQDVNFEGLDIPEGYVMHKLFHDSGAVVYALGEVLETKCMLPNYHVLVYFVDQNEWECTSR